MMVRPLWPSLYGLRRERAAIPPDGSEFRMPKIEIVDVNFEDVTPKRIENE